jgi:ribosomal protein S18 acetylase RimI-like enzyme
MIRIRTATPADAPFLGWIVLAAGRSHVATSFWDLLLDRPGDAAIESFLSERFLTAPWRSWWHHAHFLVAEVDGEPAAALSGFAPFDPAVREPEAALTDAVHAHGWDDARLGAGIERASPFFTCMMEPDRGTWLVENVATLPAFRRRGLVAALLEEVLARGRAAGHDTAQLTLFVGNRSAQFAYERAGFAITKQRTHPVFEAAIGCPGLARMQRPL